MAGTCSCWHTYCCKRPAWLELLIGSGKHCGKPRNGCQVAAGTFTGSFSGAESPAPYGRTRSGRPRRRPGPRAGSGTAMGGRKRKDVRQNPQTRRKKKKD